MARAASNSRQEYYKRELTWSQLIYHLPEYFLRALARFAVQNIMYNIWCKYNSFLASEKYLLPRLLKSSCKWFDKRRKLAGHRPDNESSSPITPAKRRRKKMFNHYCVANNNLRQFINFINRWDLWESWRECCSFLYSWSVRCIFRERDR